MAEPARDEMKTTLSETITTVPTVCPQDQDHRTPLRVLAFDTQTTCARLFGRHLSNYLRLGHLNHPYVVAATLGPERIHTKIGNEQTRRLWETRVSAAPERVRTVTYEHATNRFLTEADRLEQKVSDRRSLPVHHFAKVVSCLGKGAICDRVPPFRYEARSHAIGHW
jgi:hypothetical protein